MTSNSGEAATVAAAAVASQLYHGGISHAVNGFTDMPHHHHHHTSLPPLSQHQEQQLREIPDQAQMHSLHEQQRWSLASQNSSQQQQQQQQQQLAMSATLSSSSLQTSQYGNVQQQPSQPQSVLLPQSSSSSSSSSTSAMPLGLTANPATATTTDSYTDTNLSQYNDALVSSAQMTTAGHAVTMAVASIGQDASMYLNQHLGATNRAEFDTARLTSYVPLQTPSMSVNPRIDDANNEILRPEFERRLSLESSLARHSTLSMAAAAAAVGGYHSSMLSRRRRSDTYSFANDTGPFFLPTRQHHKLFTIDQKHNLIVQIQSKMDRGFFLADNDWTCYRRNYFQVSSSFSLQTSNHHPFTQPEIPCLIEGENGIFYHVNQFSLGVAARVSNSDKKIDLVQHTPKRDKGPQNTPSPKPIRAGGNLNMSSVGSNHSIVTFERVQFKTATANNGKRRAAQQYYVLLVELYAETSAGKTFRVATAQSAPLVVRGRSPGHYADHHERYNPLAVGRSISHHGGLSSSPPHMGGGSTDLSSLSSPFSSYPSSHYGGASAITPLGSGMAKMEITATSGGNSMIMSPATPSHLAGQSAAASNSNGYPFPSMMSDIPTTTEASSNMYNPHDSLGSSNNGSQHQIQMTSPITPSTSGGASYDDHTAAAAAAAAAVAYQQNNTNNAGPMAIALTPSNSNYGSHLPSISEVPSQSPAQVMESFRTQDDMSINHSHPHYHHQTMRHHSMSSLPMNPSFIASQNGNNNGANPSAASEFTTVINGTATGAANWQVNSQIMSGAVNNGGNGNGLPVTQAQSAFMTESAAVGQFM